MRTTCILANHKSYSEDLQKVMKSALATHRLLFVCNKYEVCGYRFYSDDICLQAMSSSFSEDEARANPDVAVIEALRWAAGCDYWYLYEKDWE